MMRTEKLLVSGMMAFILSIAAAFAQDTSGAFLTEKLYEQLQPAANVSGHIIAGFGVTDGTEAVSKPLATASFEAGRLFPAGEKSSPDNGPCLRFVSQDGLYESNFRVTLAPGAGEVKKPFDLVKQSVEETFLAKLPRKAMAVSFGLTDRSDCDGEMTSMAAVAWNLQPPADPVSYTLQINSRGADEVILAVAGQELPCTKRQAPQRVAFDYECILEKKHFAGDSADIQIYQIRRGGFDTPIAVKLLSYK